MQQPRTAENLSDDDDIAADDSVSTDDRQNESASKVNLVGCHSEILGQGTSKCQEGKLFK